MCDPVRGWDHLNILFGEIRGLHDFAAISVGRRDKKPLSSLEKRTINSEQACENKGISWAHRKCEVSVGFSHGRSNVRSSPQFPLAARVAQGWGSLQRPPSSVPGRQQPWDPYAVSAPLRSPPMFPVQRKKVWLCWPRTTIHPCGWSSYRTLWWCQVGVRVLFHGETGSDGSRMVKIVFFVCFWGDGSVKSFLAAYMHTHRWAAFGGPKWIAKLS